LQSNALQELPTQLGKLAALQELHVYNNELEALPTD